LLSQEDFSQTKSQYQGIQVHTCWFWRFLSVFKIKRATYCMPKQDSIVGIVFQRCCLYSD
jgi:hypothetical protein